MGMIGKCGWRGAAVAALMGCLGGLNAARAGEAVLERAAAQVSAVSAGGRLAVERTECYYPLLKGKKVGVVANHASVFYKRPPGTGAFSSAADFQADCDGMENAPVPPYIHLVDSLLADGVAVVRLFSPEHGLRGEAEAGAHVKDGTDALTGLPVVSLYGAHKKPTSEDLAGLDILLFDLQDVGLRFYTYISTLHYVMEACAEAGLPLVVIDRPNPHIGAIDGPLLDTACCRSFIGMHPVPVLYGLTIGEYARMIQGEGWLKPANGDTCVLTVIPMAGYTRRTPYALPLPPSPNLRSQTAVMAYPSLCLFEGTPVSVGRGTDRPFACYGFAESPVGGYRFRPVSMPGKAADPPYRDRDCRGYEARQAAGWLTDDGLISAARPAADVASFHPLYLNLKPLLTMYKAYPDSARFFTKFFRKLAGNTDLETQIRAGWSEERIRAGWQPALEAYRRRAERYYLYE